MPISLPPKPTLRQPKIQAKELLKRHKVGDVTVCPTIKMVHRYRQLLVKDIMQATISLQEIQFALALSYGFKNWGDLKSYVENQESVSDGLGMESDALSMAENQNHENGREEMKIMVCYDGDSDNSAVISKGKERAAESSADVYLVCVLTGGTVGQLDGLGPAKDALEKTQADFVASGIDCKSKVAFGKSAAGEKLVEYAEENAIDEIIIGIQKTSKVGKFLFGSTAQHVILEAPCPVLTVK